MKNMSRLFLFSALTLMLLLSACAPEEGTPTVVGTLPGDLTASPPALETETPGTAETETTLTAETAEATATVDLTGTVPATDTTQTAGTATTETPGTPVTGADVILLECQFCLEEWAMLCWSSPRLQPSRWSPLQHPC